MKASVVNRKCLVLIAVLLVFGTQGISYGQVPTLVASTSSPLTEGDPGWQAGHHRVHWDGRDEEGRSLASGMYLYRLVTGEDALTRKLMLLR